LGLSEPLLSALFCSPLSAKALRGELLGEDVLSAFRDAHQLTADDMRLLWQDFWTPEAVNLRLLGVLSKLRPSVRIIVCSNFWSNWREIIIDRFDLAHVYDDIVVSADVGFVKPDARLFSLISEVYECPIHEIALLDDLASVVNGARRVGVNAIHYQPEQGCEEAVLQWGETESP